MQVNEMFISYDFKKNVHNKCYAMIFILMTRKGCFRTIKSLSVMYLPEASQALNSYI